MSRSLHIRNEAGAWLATPSSKTTVEELQRGLEAFPDLKVIVECHELTIVRKNPNTEPPTTEDLAGAMFGVDNDATLVEETGQHRTIDEDSILV